MYLVPFKDWQKQASKTSIPLFPSPVTLSERRFRTCWIPKQHMRTGHGSGYVCFKKAFNIFASVETVNGASLAWGIKNEAEESRSGEISNYKWLNALNCQWAKMRNWHLQLRLQDNKTIVGKAGCVPPKLGHLVIPAKCHHVPLTAIFLCLGLCHLPLLCCCVMFNIAQQQHAQDMYIITFCS